MTSTSLTNLENELRVNPDLLEMFLRNPSAVLAANGVEISEEVNNLIIKELQVRKESPDGDLSPSMF